jgi:hypothetical protein
MQPRAMLFLHLLGRNNSAAKVCELQKLMLDCLQAFTSLSVNDLSTYSVPAVTPKLLVQLLNVGDLRSEHPNLGSKNCQIIHMNKNTFLASVISRLSTLLFSLAGPCSISEP